MDPIYLFISDVASRLGSPVRQSGPNFLIGDDYRITHTGYSKRTMVCLYHKFNKIAETDEDSIMTKSGEIADLFAKATKLQELPRDTERSADENIKILLLSIPNKTCEIQSLVLARQTSTATLTYNGICVQLEVKNNRVAMSASSYTKSRLLHFNASGSQNDSETFFNVTRAFLATFA